MEVTNSLKTELNQRQPQLLEILQYPHPKLLEKSNLVTTSVKYDKHVANLLDDLEFTMQVNRGIGLAAVQVGVPLSMFVIRDQTRTVKVINPVINETTGLQYEPEGCLSVVGISAKVRRPASIKVSYFDEMGEFVSGEFTGLLARAFIHEYEHTLGKVFLDHVNKYKKETLLKKYKKIKKSLGLHL
jgi:peptide deformylase